MGESIIGRPIGPSYVPGTLQGQSSANAPVNPTPSLPPGQTPVIPPNPMGGLPGSNMKSGGAQQFNPAQDPRQKWWNKANQTFGMQPPAGSGIKVAGAIKAPSAIGTSQIAPGFKQWSSKNG